MDIYAEPPSDTRVMDLLRLCIVRHEFSGHLVLVTFNLRNTGLRSVTKKNELNKSGTPLFCFRLRVLDISVLNYVVSKDCKSFYGKEITFIR